MYKVSRNVQYTKLEKSAVSAARTAGGDLIMKYMSQGTSPDITRWSTDQVNEFIETLIDKYIEKADQVLLDNEVPF